ncbi:MAG: Ig-like domain-containing protein [Clostridia bacterium]|nr:Ig-like domain-containing protein [Clostridia bacterium]
MNKRIIRLIISALLCSLIVGAAATGLAAAGPAAALSTTSVTIGIGEKTTITVLNAEGAQPTWSSNNKQVATVTSKGVVKGIAAGTATIKCKVNGKTLKASVTVEDRAALNVTSATIGVGKTKTLKVSNAGGRAVTWSSNNTKVATVTSKGVVKGVAAGTATIKCKMAGKTLKASIKVEDRASLNATAATIHVGKTKTLKVSNAAGRALTWSSSNKKVATVSSKGVITAVKAGTATIKCQVENGKLLKAKITVTDDSAISDTALTLVKGTKKTVKISKLYGRTVTWTSSDAGVASVSSTGKITAKGVGAATIKAQVANGKTFAVNVRVVPSFAYTVGTVGDINSGYEKPHADGSSGWYGRRVTFHFTNNTEKDITYIKFMLNTYHGTESLVSLANEFTQKVVAKSERDYTVVVSNEVTRVSIEIVQILFADGSVLEL